MQPRLTIRVQSVLYCPPAGSINRYLRGLRHAIAAVDRAAYEVEVLFGDCSPERSLSATEESSIRAALEEVGARRVAYEFFGENLGHGGGHNRLILDADETTLVMFLNPDTCIAPLALVELARTLADPSIGIAEARQLPLEHQKAFDPSSGDTSWASGGCSMVRAGLFNEVGAFDTDSFFMYCDDVDLSWRIRLAGSRVVHQPAAVVFHDKRLSAQAAYVPSEAEHYYAALASLLMAVKYSRPDVLERQLGDFSRSPHAVHARVLEEYHEREREGRLPAALDHDGSVGQFQSVAYADSRFEIRV